MKKRVLISLLILIIFSCSNKEKEIIPFLKTNYSFNERVLNHFREIYYVKSSEQVDVKIEELNVLDIRYKELIFKTNKAILDKDSNVKELLLEGNEILKKTLGIVNYREDFSTKKLPNIESKDSVFQLNLMKNKLVIAMSYAFEYAGRDRFSVDRIRKLDSVNTRVTSNKNKSIQINLSSDIVQEIPRKRVVTLIDQMMYKGKEKKLNYTLINDYTFANILLDSLADGKYKLKGKVKIYNRNGEFDIPFEEKFEIK